MSKLEEIPKERGKGVRDGTYFKQLELDFPTVINRSRDLFIAYYIKYDD
jgi:hypothetical protein